MEPFAFVDSPLSLNEDGALNLSLRRDLANRDSLFAWYAENLRFPDYFGWNWDAFDECLRDLSWISEHKIVLYHWDTPLLGSREDQKTYLDILAYTVGDWKDDAAHNLVAAFHPAARIVIKSLWGRE